MSNSDYSFYYLRPDEQYDPKIFYDKEPLTVGESSLDPNNKQESDFSNEIDFKPKKPKQLNPETQIKVSNIEDNWRSAHYGKEDGFDSNPFHSMDDLHQWYMKKGEAPLNLLPPPFVPSDKIFLDDVDGIHSQWKIYYEKTGHIKKNPQLME